MFVLYHNDLDGHAAAAVIAHTYQGFHSESKNPITFHSINYKDDVPFEQIKKNEEVIIVDFSLQKSGEWERLLEITTRVVWIDHHETSINKEGVQNTLRGLRTTEGSGASLTWKYYQNAVPMPRAIELVEDWDTWTHAFGDETLHFMSGMGMEDMSPEAPLWTDLLSPAGNDILDDIIKNGSIIKGYKEQSGTKYLDTFGFETTLDGYNVLAINRGLISSLMFGDKIEKYDIVSSFVFDGSLFTVSLYSTKVHVGEIAQKHGGGGHPGAAGFQCKELPYKKEG